jgi:hypothetical protein
MRNRDDPSSNQIVQLVCKMEPAFRRGEQARLVGARVRSPDHFDRSVHSVVVQFGHGVRPLDTRPCTKMLENHKAFREPTKKHAELIVDRAANARRSRMEPNIWSCSTKRAPAEETPGLGDPLKAVWGGSIGAAKFYRTASSKRRKHRSCLANAPYAGMNAHDSTASVTSVE